MEDKVLYKGKFLTITGRECNNKQWELVNQPNAVGIIVLDEDDNILLVRQYRVALRMGTFEIPAGCLDVDGEHPANCMARELEEEAHIKINSSQFHTIFQYVPMAGCSDSHMTLYVTRIRGKRPFEVKKNDTDADVKEIVWLPFKAFEQLMKSKVLGDGKTIMAYLYLKTLMKNEKICLDYIDENYPQKYSFCISDSQGVLTNTVKKGDTVHIIEYHVDTQTCHYCWFWESDYEEAENFIGKFGVKYAAMKSMLHYKQINHFSELGNIISEEEISILEDIKNTNHKKVMHLEEKYKIALSKF